ncbi:hypothetical protein LMH87_002885 [Akanthomyces muscarius]|uniref:Uncharacterized protein n=1 Tax=Akanthomyces muscarius TaxID=2231603 RepID=A0A9W8Q8K7_AKAMU|nr:hypothetical protein LMH87_002885 [Akanthomyces muscarius]KAJ4148414.1 hypothetical protein LMH87_002885 [Akanthomyces muscarius]
MANSPVGQPDNSQASSQVGYATDNAPVHQPVPCTKCGQAMGHRADCSYKYRNCWTYGMRSSKKQEGSFESQPKQ